MGVRLAGIAVAVCLPVLVSACSSPAAGPAAAPATPPPTGHLLMTVTADGAVVLERMSGTYVGVDRTGGRVWTDPDAFARGASVVCVGRCPDAVVSGTAPGESSEPAPLLYTGGVPAPFAVPEAARRTVLAARSAGDAVVVETDAAGASVIRLVRSGGDQRVAVSTPRVGWFESPDGTAAVLLPRVPSGPATVRWFGRDGAGWRATGSEFAAARLRDACVARDGTTALLTGPEPRLVRDRTRTIPVRTDLPVVSECALGERGGAVLARSFRGSRRHTDVRGVGLDGVQTWSRDYDCEAAVATDPSGERTAIAHDGVLEVLDRTGRVIRGEAGVEGVRFTAAGQLVVVAPGGEVRWLS
jgi:hypothetical protein